MFSSQTLRNIRLLTWFNFFTDFQFYAPIAIIYFAQVSGSYALGFAVMSIEMLSTSILELPTGILSDRLGRKKTIVLGAGAAVLSLVFYAIGINFWILALGSVFAGLARSLYSGNNQALLHDTLKETGQEEEYASYSGKLNSMFQLALAASALIGGFVAYFSFQVVMLLSLIPQVICLGLALQIVEPKIHDPNDQTNIYDHLKEAIDKFKTNGKLRKLSLASILDYGIGETLYQFNSAFIALIWPVWAVGLAKMLSNLFAAAGMRLSGKITKKIGFMPALLTSNLITLGLNVVAAGFPTVASPVLLASTSFPYGISQIAKDSLFQKEFSDKQRATMGSLNSLFGSLFFAVFAFGFGFLADKIAPNMALIIGEIMLLPVIWIYWSLFRKNS